MMNNGTRLIRSLCLLVLVAVLPGSRGVANPHGSIQQLGPGRQAARKRIPLRSIRPHQNAPDDQTAPLEEGTHPEIDPARRVVLKIEVVDEDTRRILPHRVHIDNVAGTYYPPDGHFDIEPRQGNTNNVSYEPDTINDGYDWAMIPEGRFTVQVPAEAHIQLKFARGLEYPLTVVELDLSAMVGKTVKRTIALKRGANMRARGWMSADTHVHNLTPLGAIRQMPVEAVDYVNLMFIGPGHPLLRRGFLTGKPDKVSTEDYIVYVSQEVRDANQGHMTLLGIKTPIKPIRAYTGVEKVIRLKPLPNEPLNWEVYDHLHAEGGLAYHAHYLFWPGWSSPVGAAIDKLDGLEWLQTDIAMRNDRTRQNIEIPGFGRRSGGRMWYDMLNCGARLPIIGGTDKMNAGRVVGGSARTYVKVSQWTHEGFLAGLRTGETFVTNGPLLHVTANGQAIGSELMFEGEGPFTVEVKAGCFTQRPIKYVEIIRNGEVAARIEVAQGQKTVDVTRTLAFEKSGWLAVRARHDKNDADNWHHAITAVHSSPIYVTVDNRLPAVEASAEYMCARMDTTLAWAQDTALWSGEASKAKAMVSFKEAQQFYRAALKRAER